MLKNIGESEGMLMQEIANVLLNCGLGIGCVAYLIYFQNHVMMKMLDTLGRNRQKISDYRR